MKDASCTARGPTGDLQDGMVTSASLLGAVISFAIAVFLRDKIAHKFELFLAAGCYGELFSQLCDLLRQGACNNRAEMRHAQLGSACGLCT